MDYKTLYEKSQTANEKLQKQWEEHTDTIVENYFADTGCADITHKELDKLKEENDEVKEELEGWKSARDDDIREAIGSMKEENDELKEELDQLKKMNQKNYHEKEKLKTFLKQVKVNVVKLDHESEEIEELKKENEKLKKKVEKLLPYFQKDRELNEQNDSLFENE